MRGGKSLADRGMIPRLLSGIYRRSRKIEKDSKGESTVQVNMSYFEIYNDRVFDLFEAVENRTTSGLQLRDNGGRTVVVGLTERPCESLKEFEKLYDEANMNRSTSATKVHLFHSPQVPTFTYREIAQCPFFKIARCPVCQAGDHDRRSDKNKHSLRN